MCGANGDFRRLFVPFSTDPPLRVSSSFLLTLFFAFCVLSALHFVFVLDLSGVSFLLINLLIFTLFLYPLSLFYVFPLLHFVFCLHFRIRYVCPLYLFCISSLRYLLFLVISCFMRCIFFSLFSRLSLPTSVSSFLVTPSFSSFLFFFLCHQIRFLALICAHGHLDRRSFFYYRTRRNILPRSPDSLNSVVQYLSHSFFLFCVKITDLFSFQ